jgi:hypothetical protein
MEAVRSFETSGATQRTTRRHIPEDDTLQHLDASHISRLRTVSQVKILCHLRISHFRPIRREPNHMWDKDRLEAVRGCGHLSA